MKTIVNLTSSRFFGGPERQMLGLAQHLDNWRTRFLSFAEEGNCCRFLERVAQSGFDTHVLTHDFPRLPGAIRELRDYLQAHRADLLLCHGYKANLVGRLATIKLGIPAVSVSRGWTSESWKVKCYEWLDRRTMRWMDQVVCVSHGQARKVVAGGVRTDQISVIHNSVITDRFNAASLRHRAELLEMFPSRPEIIVAAVGRLSPEKGFGVLIEAAAQIASQDNRVVFVIFGEGTLRGELEQRIRDLGLTGRMLLSGFREDLDSYFPHFDLLALPSFTEGMPNVVLEAFAAGVPVVASNVGGVPEVVDDGVNGLLVPAGDVAELVDKISILINDDRRRKTLGIEGRVRVENEFSFQRQAESYDALLRRLLARSASHAPKEIEHLAASSPGNG